MYIFEIYVASCINLRTAKTSKDVMMSNKGKKLEYWTAAQAMYNSDNILSKKKENDMCE